MTRQLAFIRGVSFLRTSVLARSAPLIENIRAHARKRGVSQVIATTMMLKVFPAVEIPAVFAGSATAKITFA